MKQFTNRFINLISKRNSKILLVSSPIFSHDEESDTFDFFSYIVAKLSQEIEERFSNFDLVVKVPKKGVDASKMQAKLIRQAIERKEEYLCVIISPVDRERMYNNLPNWIKQIGDNRILFIDQGFSLDSYEFFHEDNVARPPYVQANWVGGGEIAGKSMTQFFIDNGITTPHIVLLEGNTGSDQRIKGFKEGVNSFNEHKKMVNPSYYNCYGNYSKKDAREIFNDYIIEAIDNKRRIDGIFACNDEMALGVRDSLVLYGDKYCTALGLDRSKKSNLPIIVGFDGIKDMTLLILNNHDFVYDTVCVYPEKQVENIVNIVEKLLISGETLKAQDKYIQISCSSFREKYMNNELD